MYDFLHLHHFLSGQRVCGEFREAEIIIRAQGTMECLRLLHKVSAAPGT